MTPDEARGRLERHVDRFNEAVTSGDWDPFVTTFVEEAEMRFVGVPAGPFVGRDRIAAAYREQPPTDTMQVLEVVDLDEDGAEARFAWRAGGTGTLAITWRDDGVAELVISFDGA